MEVLLARKQPVVGLAPSSFLNNPSSNSGPVARIATQISAQAIEPEVQQEGIADTGVLQIPEPARAIRPRPQLAISDVELRARIAWDHYSTPHFLIAYDRTRFQEHEMRTAASLFEEGYSSIFALTHESFPDRFRMYLVDRHAAGLLGRSTRSHFNVEERAIYLLRSSTQTAYSELLYLLTHAMRLARFRRHYGVTPGWTMLEDAFSVFLQLRLTVSDHVFPFYSVEPDIVAFHVLRDSPSGRLSTAWQQTENASDLDRYVLAGAFMLFLGDTFSDDRIVQLSKCEEPVTSETFKRFLGVSLEELEVRWLEHLPTALMTLTHEEHTYAIARWEQCFESRN